MNQPSGSPELISALFRQMEEHPLKAISFKDYMEACLYHEPYGYYRRSSLKIGKKGDFYTSSSIGSVMGEMLGGYVSKQWHSYSLEAALHLVEWGGGNGRLALHILDELKLNHSSLYARLTYTLIESSGYHRQLQRETLLSHAQKIKFLSEQEWLAEHCPEGAIILANELLDAFAVSRVRYAGGQFYENFVARQGEAFVERWLPLSEGQLTPYLEEYKYSLLEGQIIEINLDAMEWIRTIGKHLATGQLIIIDYGDTVDELYAPYRLQGTLLCYRNHQAFDNPYIHQGEQDITSHVNFTACIQAGLEVGFEKHTLQSQREFLVTQGILERLQDTAGTDPFSPAAKKNRAIRQLLISDQMSELFKVLIQTKKR